MVTIKNLKNQDGQALVEFAIVLPILMLLIMGIFQFGMMLNTYITIGNAAREGTRAGILGSSDAEIQGLIISASPSLEPQNLIVSITPNEINRISGEYLTVKVTYNYKLTVPIISNLFNNVIVLTSQTTMRVE